MERAVWIILNNNFSLTLDSEIKDGKVVDKRFSPGNDLWTTEIPQLRFSDENIQNDYNDFVFDIVALYVFIFNSPPTVLYFIFASFAIFYLSFIFSKI